MKANSQKLLDKSLSAMLAAIEIYNKPNFSYREESFSILLVTSWELLLKAKIVKDNGNRIRSIYVRKGAKIKRNRSNHPLTVDILSAAQQLQIPDVVYKNLESFVDVRDAAIHYFNNDTVSYVVFMLGAAALQNYQKLVNNWFGKSLSSYDFYILPLGFSYKFRTLSLIDLRSQPNALANLIAIITDRQLSCSTTLGTYHFACEIETNLRSAKKFSGKTDLKVSVSTEADSPIVTRDRNMLDAYPLTYKQLRTEVIAETGAKQGQMDKLIAKYQIKRNLQYSHFVFRSKGQETVYLENGIVPNGVSSIYNGNAVRFLASELLNGDA